MKTFNLNEYKLEKNDAKFNAFCKYLYDYFYDGNEDVEFEDGYFEILDEEALIQSLNYYINNGNVTAQVTAENYITVIKTFFKYLREYYSITNPIFLNTDQFDAFYDKAKTIISKLKEVESKNFLSDDDYEKLVKGIDIYCQNLDIDEICEEAEKTYKQEQGFKRAKEYYNFVSIIPTKLAMEYGLSNSDTAKLKLADLNLDNKTLRVNRLFIPLDDELVNLFKMYLKLREKVLSLYSRSVDFLFVKNDATSYLVSKDNKAENGRFYQIMKKEIKNQRVTELAARRIVQMLTNGLDFATVSTLTKISTNKLVELLAKYNEDEDKDKMLQNFFKDNLKNTKKYAVKPKNKGHFTCSFCGKESYAISDNWVLVQFEQSGNKYVACKACGGGRDGKIRY